MQNAIPIRNALRRTRVNPLTYIEHSDSTDHRSSEKKSHFERLPHGRRWVWLLMTGLKVLKGASG
jgi:hypothetical protein